MFNIWIKYEYTWNDSSIVMMLTFRKIHSDGITFQNYEEQVEGGWLEVIVVFQL